jgi:hypothetical protein
VRYSQAGVSLATAETVVERLRTAVDSTRTAPVVGPLGAFAGLYALDEERLLAATTDSVGTKLMLSRRAGRLFDAGVDLAAHCVNDVLTTGAEPLFFLDYVAAGELDPDQVTELVEGAAARERDLFFQRQSHDRTAIEVRSTIRRYMDVLGIASGFFRVLLVMVWIDRALFNVQGREWRTTNSVPHAVEKAEKFIQFTRIIAEHRELWRSEEVLP